MSEQLTDQVLVERVQAGDKSAYNLLVLRYQNKIANLVSRYVPAGDVPDIVQETFIKAYRSITSFRGDSFFYTWLYRIAVNTAKNYLTAQGRRFSGTDIDIHDVDNHDRMSFLQEIENPENLILSNEIKEVVFHTIESLPDDLKTALTLREIDGMSYEEIANAMGTPIGTVRSRIFRAREIINDKLKPLIEQ